MKKLVFVIIALISSISFAALLVNDRKQTPTSISVPNTTPTSTIKKQSIIFDFKEIPIRISWATAQPEQVELYSNLQAKETSEKIKSERNCRTLVNGGFYSKTNTHLGLFVSNFEVLSNTLQSPLLNGFLSIKFKDIVINSLKPNSDARIALQSGPLLVQNNKPLILSINNDQPDRRIVAATNYHNDLIFLAIYRYNSDFQGPLLQDLPQIIELFKKQTGISITDAINLDGGSASAFITAFEYISELSLIGSYFCAK